MPAQLALVLILGGLVLLAVLLRRALPAIFLAASVALAATLFASTLPDATDLLLPVAFKGLLLMAGTAALALGCRVASAGVRHFIWTLGIVVTLVAPLGMVLAPRWTAHTATRTVNLAAVSHAVGESTVQVTRPTPAHPLPLAVGQPDRPAPAPPRAVFSVGLLLWQVWVCGAAFLVMRLALRWLGLRQLLARATSLTDAAWHAALRAAAETLGVRQPVRLLESTAVSVPCAAGVRRPAILVPADAEAWPAERRHLVLLHEMAHIRRHDGLTQWLAEWACALCWMNPLVWWAARRMRAEREQACDDRVLAAGSLASSYAAHLLEIARGLCRPRPLPGVVAMASHTTIERRLRAILDAHLRRAPITRRAALVSMLLATAGLVTLAGWQGWQGRTLAVEEPDLLPATGIRAVAQHGVATLPDGTRVTFIGASDNPRDHYRWWRLDGTTLDELTGLSAMAHSELVRGRKAGDRWLLFKIDHYPMTRRNYSIRTDSLLGFGERTSHAGGGNGWSTYPDGTFTLCRLQPSAREARYMASTTMTARVGVAIGSWRPIVRLAAARHGGQATGVFAGGGGRLTITLVQHPVTSDEIRLTMRHTATGEATLNGMAVRLVAIRHNGDVDTGINFSASSSSVEGAIQNYYLADRTVDISAIREFRYEASPYTWVEFRGIPPLPKE